MQLCESGLPYVARWKTEHPSSGDGGSESTMDSDRLAAALHKGVINVYSLQSKI